MACEDCLEVCLMGLVVVGRKYVWCLVIVVICMGFEQSHHLRVAMEVTKGGLFYREGRFSLYNTAVF